MKPAQACFCPVRHEGRVGGKLPKTNKSYHLESQIAIQAFGVPFYLDRFTSSTRAGTISPAEPQIR
jgi:hypothetical protein